MDWLISADGNVKKLYGLRGDQIVHNSSKTADAIPEDGEMVQAETKTGENAAAESQAETVRETEKAKDPNGNAINVVPEQVGDVYVTGDTAFSLFYFALEGANEYISDIDLIQKKLDGIATVYDILAPSSVGIMLTDQAQEKLGISSQKEAISYAFSNIQKLNSKVKCVNICQNLVEFLIDCLNLFRTGLGPCQSNRSIADQRRRKCKETVWTARRSDRS